MLNVGDKVRIRGAKNIRSKYGILNEQMSDGVKKYPAWVLKVGCGEDKRVDGKYIFLGEDYLEKVN